MSKRKKECKHDWDNDSDSVPCCCLCGAVRIDEPDHDRLAEQIYEAKKERETHGL